MEKQFVLFKVGKEEFGLNITEVQEIIKMQAITAMPDTPEYFSGILNLRNRIIPVLDLGIKLGLKKTEESDARIVVVNLEEKTFGLVVDFVSEVLKVDEDKIDNNTQNWNTNNKAVAGLIKEKERLIILLDAKKLVKEDYEELDILDENCLDSQVKEM